jgi:PIN domain nuclease of toxin-antitoxin system
VRLLLDTQVALWAIVDSPRLTAEVRALIADEANTLFVSVASLWEIAIKHGLARGHPGDMPLSAQQALDYFLGAGMRILDISSEHALAVASLAPNHADPFDRMLVAQSLSEPLRLVTPDPQVAAYSDAIILF